MITVFTPAYNREYILGRLYESLRRQTCTDFEWVVVDDGSTDGTADFFSSICGNESGFDIVYEKQENGGKHRAVNRGVKLARGELFFIVDSDDYLTDDAVEKVTGWYSRMENSDKFCAVSGARGYSADEYIGTVADASLEYVDIRNTEREKYGITGDKAEAWITDVMRKYPFPEFEGENYLAEGVVWNAMARDGYLIRFYRDIIYIGNYLEDGLTRNTEDLIRRNPRGYLEWIRTETESHPDRKRVNANLIYSYYRVAGENSDRRALASALGISLMKLNMIIKLGDIASGRKK